MTTLTVSARGTEPGAIPVTLEVNGAALSLLAAPHVTLLDLLREQLQLTGTKKGCDHGQCGACTVLVDAEPFNSCAFTVYVAFARTRAGRDSIPRALGINFGRHVNCRALEGLLLSPLSD